MNQQKKFFKSVFFVALMGVTFLSLIPSDSASRFNHQDKLNHFIAYSILSFLCQTAFWTKRKPFKTILLSIVLLGYSIAIEWLQQFTYRDPSWYDVIANGTGLLIGLIIAKAVQFNTSASVDKSLND